MSMVPHVLSQKRMNQLLDGFAFQNIEAIPTGSRSLLKKRLRALGRQTGLNDLATAVVFVDDQEMKSLNQMFRGKNKTTDVLSFSAWEGEEMPGLTHILGDIVISVPMAEKQAKERSHTLGEELVVLAIHGLIHLLGFDHENSDEEALMHAECEMAFLDMLNMDVSLCLAGRPF